MCCKCCRGEVGCVGYGREFGLRFKWIRDLKEGGMTSGKATIKSLLMVGS